MLKTGKTPQIDTQTHKPTTNNALPKQRRKGIQKYKMYTKYNMENHIKTEQHKLYKNGIDLYCTGTWHPFKLRNTYEK